MIQKLKNYFTAVYANMAQKGHEVMDGTAAEAYVDTGVKILIAVVVGALLLVGLVYLFKEVILAKTQDVATDMFNKAGDAAGSVDVDFGS